MLTKPCATDQLKSISRNEDISSHTHGYDFIIAGIPPLDMTPYAHSIAANDKEKLELLELLNLQYNSELAAFADSFRNEIKRSKSKTNVFFYDMAKLVRLTLLPVLNSATDAHFSACFIYHAVETNVRRPRGLFHSDRSGNVTVS